MHESSNSLIEAKKLTKRFGDFVALNAIDLKISENTCIGLVGPNGAGKSSLIKLIYGASPLTSGHLSVFGLDPRTDYRVIKRRLGVVTQDNALDEAMTVEENMRMFARFLSIPKEVETDRIDSLLDFMQLLHKKKSPIMALSGGMQRRLAFVRALLGSPQLIILDEPTTGLDPAVRQLLWSKIIELKKNGATILITTHYMDEAEQLCDEVVIMDKGVIKIQGSPAHLIQEHCPGYVAVFKDSNDLSLKGVLQLAQSHNFVVSELYGWVQVRALKIEQLLAFQNELGRNASILRPSNLEDVFLNLTGRGIDSDA